MSSDAFQSVAGLIGLALLGIAGITISNTGNDTWLFWFAFTLGAVIVITTVLDRGRV